MAYEPASPNNNKPSIEDTIENLEAMNDLEKKDFSVMQTNIAVILERTKSIPDMAEKINEIDKKQSSICTDVKNNKDDIKDLQKKSDTWNILNSLGAFIASVIAIITGDWS